MFIVLNGPLGVGKSTLAEALTESIDSCAMLSGDLLLAVTELDDLRGHLANIDPMTVVRCFLLTLPVDANRRRIDELRFFAEERDILAQNRDLGELFEVSAQPSELVPAMLRPLGLS